MEHLSPYAIPFDVPELPFEEAVALAADTGVISGDAGPLLETVVDMLDVLERPDAYYDVIQVAGTNGKSSTVRFAAAALVGEGLRTALYTSPHLVHYPERMEIDGAVVSDAAFAHGVSAAVEAGRRVNEARCTRGEAAYTITPFDLLTVAALVVFAEARVDVAVLEVGLGGRWDATSATNPVAVAVTGIGLDHTRILGDTLAQIAAEKAAIIKPGRAVVLGEGTHEPSVQRVMDERCAWAGVEPVVSRHQIERLPQRLGDDLVFSCVTPRASYRIALSKPAYQAQNAACAINLVEAYLGRPLDAEALCRSLRACPTPGRFDVRRERPLVLIDACHNPQSCASFVGSLDEIDPCVGRRPTLVIATLSDKDARGIVRALVPAFPRVRVTQTASERALPATELAALVAEELEREGRAQEDLVAVHATVADALDAVTAAGEDIVAAGTITLAGEVARLL
ncbi:folylpolyglutamate synthase/dihydrofolate synthase family protein [uncultured Enorma sp.]|uniref:bifunctional folylpolyglutamate synthase/dihydrofolate synthase n=1 Tax=uncultured Enorma sp. TaxID=1714346 RepID=UPI0026367E6E|nr:bifunctional folylpolyglutamate synthase/dihydrofolate synthase [uncultured Enorma sp.]